MTDTYEKLKKELKVYYPDFTDDKLDEATENLIKFFTIGAKIAFVAKVAPKGEHPDC